jgi:hypothetical protein
VGRAVSRVDGVKGINDQFGHENRSGADPDRATKTRTARVEWTDPEQGRTNQLDEVGINLGQRRSRFAKGEPVDPSTERCLTRPFALSADLFSSVRCPGRIERRPGVAVPHCY